MIDPVRQLLVKMAYTPNPFRGNLYNSAYKAESPEQYGQLVSRDIQTYGHLAPGSDEYNMTMQEKGFTPEYMQGISSAGQRVLRAANDPEFVRGMQQGTANISDLYKDFQGSSGIAKALGGWSNVAAYGLRNPIDSAQALYGAGRDWLTNSDQSSKQFGDKLMSSIDMNSPLARAAKSRGATTYLNSKIQDIFSGLGGFGKGVGGGLSFLLGLLSKIPGYDTLANKLDDWSGGFKPGGQRALPHSPFAVKAGSVRFIQGKPYSHYAVTSTQCGSEVLTWNRQ